MYDELVKRLKKTSEDFGELDSVSVMLLEAADAIEKLKKQNTDLRSKIRRMKSDASWDEDIRRGQVQGMW